MTKKKSFLAFVLAMCVFVPAMFVLTACGQHTHTYNTEVWKSDATSHWHEATCEHTNEKIDIADHTFGDWAEKTPAGEDQNRQFSRKCTECEYEDVLTFEDTKTNGSYCMLIKSVLITDSVKKVQVKILRGKITVGDNVSVDGISGNFSIDKINMSETGSASCGEEVELILDEEGGKLEDITNSKSGYLMYEPDKTEAYNKSLLQ